MSNLLKDPTVIKSQYQEINKNSTMKNSGKHERKLFDLKGKRHGN